MGPLDGRAACAEQSTGAVLCAVEGCDHTGCQGGPFRVVFLYSEIGMSMFYFCCVYSSETGAWSERVSFSRPLREDCCRDGT